MFTLVPYTTCETQPLDTPGYSPLKANRQGFCHKYIQDDPPHCPQKVHGDNQQLTLPVLSMNIHLIIR